jgi:cyanophycin synthetase
MADQESSADRPRLVQGWRLFGANWMAARTVFVCRLAGAYRPEFWSVVRDLIARILPARAGDPLLDDTPATLAEATETLARFLLAWCGHPVAAIERTELGRGARMHAAVAMGSPEMTSAACVFAIRVLTRAAGMPHADAGWIAQSTENLIQARRDGAQWLRSSRAFIARAAEARDIPWRVFTPAQHVLVLGEGRFARRFDASATWRTSILATSVAGNKRSGNLTLRRCGLPAPFQIRVDSADEVTAALPRLGLPLVLKPLALREMQGMRIVYRAADIGPAYAYSSGFEQPVVAESYIPGNEYRVLVLDGRVVAACLRLPVTVTGDGRASIADLIARENLDPRRGPLDQGYALAPIRIEALSERYLAECDRSLTDVPAAGAVVQVHPLPMMQFGGNGREDVTHRIHPDNRAMAEAAVAAFGLDIAGIDLRMPDIAQSWREVGAGICEVNPQPNLAVHYGFPSPVDPAGILIDRIYPPADRGPMRHVLLVGDGDLAAHAAAIAAALRQRFGWRVATATRDGVDLDGWKPGQAIANLPDAYGVIVEDREIDAAVYAAPAAAIAATGIGARRLDVAMAQEAGTGTPWRMAAATVDAAGTRLRRLPPDPQTAARRACNLLRPPAA